MDGHTCPGICLTVLVSLSLFPNELLGQNKFDLGGIGTHDRLDITELHISSHVESRFATVDVFSRMVNNYNTSTQAAFVVQIPETAFITNFSMVINGTSYLGKVEEKKESKSFDEAQEEGQSAWQISYHGRDRDRDMDVFEISVNVEANSEVSFALIYQELLERRLSKYVQRFIVQPLQIVPNLSLKASFKESQGFKDFDIKLPQNILNMTGSVSSAHIQASSTTRTVEYKPSVEEQKRFNADIGINGEFIVEYDVNQRQDGGVMIIKDDCFIHYVAPKSLQPLAKNIVFLVDVSGSMAGEKIQQARKYLLGIIDKLRPDDVFNILLFSGNVSKWRSEPQAPTITNIAAAKYYIKENVKADGYTNINDALLESISSLKSSFSLPGNRAHLIVFISDGEPSTGVTDKEHIRRNVLLANDGDKRIVIFSLAYGFDLDFEFLEKLSWDNDGEVRRIKNDQEAMTELTNFFLQIEKAVLQNVDMHYDQNMVDPNNVTRMKYQFYFDGSELVVAGRTKSAVDTPDKLDASVVGIAKGGQVKLKVSKKVVLSEQSESACKLYAYLKIKDLLRKKAIAKTEEEAENFEQTALDLSLQYGFVTPLTSFVVVPGEPIKDWGRPQKVTVAAVTDSSHLVNITIPANNTNSAGFVTPRLALYYITLMSAAVLP